MVDVCAPTNASMLALHERAYMDHAKDVLQSYQDALQFLHLEIITFK